MIQMMQRFEIAFSLIPMYHSTHTHTEAAMGDAAASPPSMDLFFSELSAAVLRKRHADGFSAGKSRRVVRAYPRNDVRWGEGLYVCR